MSQDSLTLTAPSPPKPTRPAKRQGSPLSSLLLGILAKRGRMPRCDLVKYAAIELVNQSKPAHPANLYTRLRALKASGLVEIRRIDGTNWVCLPNGGPAGRRRVFHGHATVRRGTAKFTAQATGCPAFSGAATLSFIK